MTEAVYNTGLKEIDLLKQGKVRDIYTLDGCLLIVATDRISCFDSVLPTPIPDKGRILTLLSLFWFEYTKDIIENHLIGVSLDDLPVSLSPYKPMLKDRFMLVRKVKPLKIECIVRGYLAGSGFAEYKEKGTVCGITLPSGLAEADKLDQPVFTPSYKADSGHDENISESEARRLVGDDVFEQVRDKSIAIYKKAAVYAETKGIIIADTKFEFGIIDGKVILIDEILTPDSSRFWPQGTYRPGEPQFSFDKQFVRDYLISIGWDKNPPAPELPPDIVSRTREKYLQALLSLTGKTLG